MEFKGIGNVFRQYSQYALMKRWESKYAFDSAVEAPYDQATNGIDGNVLSCPHDAFTTLKDIPDESYDLIWNFGFLQREPHLIYEMKKISRRYLAAFVPNFLNPGNIVHKLYHKMYNTPCTHPERGNRFYMNLKGIRKIFECAGLKILESGFVDSPPWPDTVVTIKEFFGVQKREVLTIPIDPRWLLPFESIAFPKRIIAHHCYLFAKK